MVNKERIFFWLMILCVGIGTYNFMGEVFDAGREAAVEEASDPKGIVITGEVWDELVHVDASALKWNMDSIIVYDKVPGRANQDVVKITRPDGRVVVTENGNVTCSGYFRCGNKEGK